MDFRGSCTNRKTKRETKQASTPNRSSYVHGKGGYYKKNGKPHESRVSRAAKKKMVLRKMREEKTKMKQERRRSPVLPVEEVQPILLVTSKGKPPLALCPVRGCDGCGCDDDDKKNVPLHLCGTRCSCVGCGDDGYYAD